MSANLPRRSPRAVIFGCSGLKLTDAERTLFAASNPLGFILFSRNCESPDQVRALVADMREAVGRENAPILIDQEGGRVARLKPPGWRASPPAARFGVMAKRDPELAREATRLNARLIAADLAPLGITMDCAPVLDLPVPGAHGIIGDRAFADDPEMIATLGRAFCDGMLDGGVLPMIKHVPGHGRAMVDSHEALPVVTTSREEMERTDFVPFRALADIPLAMTAHVHYTALDDAKPATLSRRVIDDVIRGAIGFDGLLLGDDLSMEALKGTLAERAVGALGAGCDVVLYCKAKLPDLEELARSVPPMTKRAIDRLERAEAFLRPPLPLAVGPARARLDDWLRQAEAA